MCKHDPDLTTSSESRQRLRDAISDLAGAGGKASTHSEQVDRLAVVGLDDKVTDVPTGGDPNALERVGSARALVCGRAPERDFGRSGDGRVREGRAETCGHVKQHRGITVRALSYDPGSHESLEE